MISLPQMSARLFLLSLSLPVVSAWAADPHMTADERAKVITLLNESRDQLLQSVDGLSEAQWKWKSAPDRWSVGECAEHIVLAEKGLFGRLQQAVANPPNPDWETKTGQKAAFLEKVMPTRTGKAKAPEEIVPAGKMSRTEVLAVFAEQRVPIVKFAEETQVALKEHTSEHPFAIFNTLNAYDWLLYIPFHTMRHVKQIQEVKATSGFPGT